LKNVGTVSAVAGDISPTGLEIARLNARSHQVIDRLDLKLSDIFAGIDDEKFDLIVSNPPYVPVEDISGLQSEVRDYEPHIALTDGADGLSIVSKILAGAEDRLGRPDGVLLIEIGWDQSERVAEILAPSEWRTVEFLPDLQGIPTILKAIRR
jgi:release factor glutamine methyltransferase